MNGAVRVASILVGIEVALAVIIGATGASGGIAGTANASTTAALRTDTAPEYSHRTVCFIAHDGTIQCATQCDNEDGNTDGRPCVWVDTDTGNAYFVDSSNYRDYRAPHGAMVGGAVG